jgi:hypothetical protein
MKKRLVLLASIGVMVLLAGCLGGGDEEKKEEEPIVNTQTLTLTGTQTGLAQAQPESIAVDITIPLDYENVVMIQVNISVDDNDMDTNGDQVGEMTLTEEEEGGNYTGTANGGTTTAGDPVLSQIVVEWDGTMYMSQRWVLNIPVTINAGEDTWPGPMLWVGTPDNGFRYTLEITYQYHDSEM